MKFLPALFAGLTLLAHVLAPSAALAADASQPIVSDSRVKTFVYNENEVYTVLTQYGYQSNIEFGKGEEIQTISVGDRVAWQIIPAGKRLFIQTLQDNAHTNLTVVTDKHAYQFDLRSTGVTEGNEDRLVYVARFYYPDEDWDQPTPIAAPEQVVSHSALNTGNEYNFGYTYSGPEQLAPVRIFDDGAATYFQFRSNVTPAILRVTADGREVPVTAQPQNGYYVVNGTSARYSVRQGQSVVCVFNERFVGR